MRFVSSRELRIRPGAVWSLLREHQDLVITANGKPIGVMTAVDEGNLEDVLATLRQGRAQSAVAGCGKRRPAPDVTACRIERSRGSPHARGAPGGAGVGAARGVSIVLDTNVLVSRALLRGGGPARTSPPSGRGRRVRWPAAP